MQATTFSDDQKRAIGKWLEDGAKLSEVQKRIEKEFGAVMTYMEVKLLVSEINVLPKDAPEPVASKLTAPAGPGPAPEAPGRGAAAPAAKSPAPMQAPAEPTVAPSGVQVAVDQLAIPGTMVSGTVTFTDGQVANWYMDQMGRLGLKPKTAGYRPPAGDVQQFQVALEAELARLGY